MKRTVTLKDIAEKTGFSINTVSHALNNKPDISDATKKLIRDVADEMGYISNGLASSLRSGVSRLIAVILGDISNPHFSFLIKEIESVMNKKGYTVIIFNTDENSETERKAIHTALSKNADGIIICPTQEDSRNIDFLRESGVPYVLIGRRSTDGKDSYVICDDENSGYLAAQHLIGLGHKKMLFFNGPEYISSARERWRGFSAALKESGLPDDTAIQAEISVNREESVFLLADYLRRYPECTGIVAFSDMIALEIIYLLMQSGHKVPRDRSVIGFDNIQSEFLFPISLTTVSTATEKMAPAAAGILLDMIENRSAGERLVLDTRLISGETTGGVER